jgi:integrase
MNVFIEQQDSSNIIPFTLVNGKLNNKKEVKYNKDGSINKSKCNKVAGKDSEVYAFRTKEEIAAMIDVFDKHIKAATNYEQRQVACRNKLLFIIGINVGIRASDLRTLRFSFFMDDTGRFKEFYVLQPMKQRKQKKFVKLFFNQTVRTAIENYISEYPFNDLNDYLFVSCKSNEPILAKHIWRIMKETASEAGIEQNIGSHSLRKTFGYWMFHNAEDKNKALVMLQNIFSHSSTIVTMRYIGLMDNEMSDAYNSLNLGLEFI